MKFMNRISIKLVTVFLTVMSLSACSNFSDTMSGVSANVKGTFNKDTGHSAYDRKDFPAAAASYLKAAEYGNPEAQYYLSFMYLEGEGIRKNGEAALSWMQKSAAGGFAPAQVQMGLRHLSGLGVAQDLVQAYAFFLKAAEVDNPEAQYFVAFMSATGSGTAKSQDAALRWFRLARSNGFPVPENFLTPGGVAALEEKKWRAMPATELVPVRSEKKQDVNTAADQAKELLRKIQTGLIRLNYNPGPADGLFGPKTEAAIKAFQTKTGLDPNGRPTQALLNRIEAE